MSPKIYVPHLFILCLLLIGCRQKSTDMQKFQKEVPKEITLSPDSLTLQTVESQNILANEWVVCLTDKIEKRELEETLLKMREILLKNLPDSITVDAVSFYLSNKNGISDLRVIGRGCEETLLPLLNAVWEKNRVTINSTSALCCIELSDEPLDSVPTRADFEYLSEKDSLAVRGQLSGFGVEESDSGVLKNVYYLDYFSFLEPMNNDNHLIRRALRTGNWDHLYPAGPQRISSGSYSQGYLWSVPGIHLSYTGSKEQLLIQWAYSKKDALLSSIGGSNALPSLTISKRQRISKGSDQCSYPKLFSEEFSFDEGLLLIDSAEASRWNIAPDGSGMKQFRFIPSAKLQKKKIYWNGRRVLPFIGICAELNFDENLPEYYRKEQILFLNLLQRAVTASMIGLRETVESDTADVIAVDSVENRLRGDDPLTKGAYKPIIYCYPTDTTELSVKLTFTAGGKFTYTYPTYSDSGWNVTAFPDGKLIDKQGKSYYSLFWEGTLRVDVDNDSGFVVHRDSLNAFFERSLDSLGLNYKEKQEFIVFWSPKLMANEYSFIHFSRKNYANSVKMEITPVPTTINRFLMLYRKADREEKAVPQRLENPGRDGFTVVEWGGAEMTGGTCEIK